jgi:hypothetical protein
VIFYVELKIFYEITRNRETLLVTQFHGLDRSGVRDVKMELYSIFNAEKLLAIAQTTLIPIPTFLTPTRLSKSRVTTASMTLFSEALGAPSLTGGNGVSSNTGATGEGIHKRFPPITAATLAG